MGFSLKLKECKNIFETLKEEYRIYAPKLFKNQGTYSDTDIVRYDEIKDIEEIEFNQKSYYSPKEVVLPITQTLFYFTEDEVMVPKFDDKKLLLFLRSCDIHALKRLDEIYLKNGEEDYYYKKFKEKVKFALIPCEKSFENCFCVSMGTNKTKEYALFVKREADNLSIEVKDEALLPYFQDKKHMEVSPTFIEKNEVTVTIPEGLGVTTFESPIWEEYTSRCIGCGKCNTVCGTCGCFTMQDIFYKDNINTGERRRVWASCQSDDFTTMAGGHTFRKKQGERMRFKVMHKIYDFNKRFGYQMCVGCGRCDDVCPEYISFSNCVNKLEKIVREEK